MFIELSFITVMWVSAPQVLVDGSSTVFPVSEAVGEEFQKLNRSLRVAVAASGTGGGFKKFCKGEIDVTGASRTIEETEREACKKGDGKAISFLEFPIAYDGITVVVHPSNTWANDLTVEELKTIWSPSSTITNWKQIREGFPDLALKLYGPGHDSGSFDYFTKVIVGKEKASRSDFTASEDDNMIVRGVSKDKGGLGYFGFAYYESNAKSLKAVAIKSGDAKAVLPTIESIGSGTYKPLSRPIYIYVNRDALKRKEVADFASFYLREVSKLAAEVGYVALPQKLTQENLDRFKKNQDAH